MPVVHVSSFDRSLGFSCWWSYRQLSRDSQTLLRHAFVYLTKGCCCGLTPASNWAPQLSPKNIFTLFLELFQMIAILFLCCFYWKLLVLLTQNEFTLSLEVFGADLWRLVFMWEAVSWYLTFFPFFLFQTVLSFDFKIAVYMHGFVTWSYHSK